MSDISSVVAEPDRFSPRARARLEALGPVTDGPFDRPGLLDALGPAHVLWVRLAHRIDGEVLDAAPHLRAIVTATTGLDHIDIDHASDRGVAVLSLRGQHDLLDSIVSTAEHTWALLLALTRRLPWAFDHVRGGGWDRDLFRGMDLAGRRLGILGHGRLGSKVARYGVAFGMHVAAHDVGPFDPAPGVAAVGSLDELLERSDVLSVHVHLDERTHHLVGATELARLPAGALLVNTARGSVVDGSAVLRSLENGHLAGAAVDVVEGEPDPWTTAPALLEAARSRDDLLVTPHIGGATHDSMARTEEHMAELLVRHLTTDGIATGVRS